MIPTSDSTRAEFIINKIANLPAEKSKIREEHGQLHTLLVGGSGTAKTSTIIMYTNTFDKDKVTMKRINFSSATQPVNY